MTLADHRLARKPYMRRRDVPVLCSEWTGMEGEPGFTSRINDIADIRWRAREGVSLSRARAHSRSPFAFSFSLSAGGKTRIPHVRVRGHARAFSHAALSTCERLRLLLRPRRRLHRKVREKEKGTALSVRDLSLLVGRVSAPDA